TENRGLAPITVPAPPGGPGRFPPGTARSFRPLSRSCGMAAAPGRGPFAGRTLAGDLRSSGRSKCEIQDTNLKQQSKRKTQREKIGEKLSACGPGAGLSKLAQDGTPGETE